MRVEHGDVVLARAITRDELGREGNFGHEHDNAAAAHARARWRAGRPRSSSGSR